MKVFVTGGAGYIGSHTCKALAEAGHTPVAYDDLSTGHRDAVRWGPLVVGSILDRDALGRALAAHRPDIVIHFAALAYVGESVLAPDRYYATNVTGTCTLLNAMRAAGVGRIVLSSSCATYGIPDALPICEHTPQHPINPYGFTKYAMERMAADFERAYGMKWVALRYFNAAGADPDGLLGENHEPETHALPLAIRAALGTGRPFTVMGTDYPTPDGSAVRDYVHVSDLADAHVKATAYLCRGGNSVALNLGTGTGTSVLELVRAVETVTGSGVPTVMAARRPGDPPALYADATKAALVLGWRPRFAGIEPMVEHAARWFRQDLPLVSNK
ncbi:UDP-glucose 4-epimerase GalE [Burkholderia multivorans]|uniref:UDP-glucose 4-epimerase GalE n=1 Tax=Burkholderia multivorans TaxID=87883 RepID=UPI00018E2833|nr:UDP-glucose 4-epimerase GalE [Burkholderia multivorans]EEE02767.1 UDP-glucose 4-epimerase [Burkholderia multivorans CGD1]MBU9311429.1 UDP-glucose 4-epimerase GalE [Burkholderia multivorans]MBU9574362.1 UDP-glucose 4-epimerase GalE [Burkholderia multivorans]MDN7948525.1 UDP-glucose 4-epimerase GalE [Burkholderia multivorans]MDN7964557.1 UDP-glucose 4-epimerase GalE [Burkholderia multivorans]